MVKTVFGEDIVKGDTIECYFENPRFALRYALMLKCTILYVPMLVEYTYKIAQARGDGYNLFEKYGIRLAIGYGQMRIVDRDGDIMDGEAIYLSGRKIAEQTTSGKSKAIIKNTPSFVSKNDELNTIINTSLSFVEVLFRKASKKQINIVYHKLLGMSDDEIVSIANISYSAVNKQCKTFGWNAIADLLNLYENVLKL